MRRDTIEAVKLVAKSTLRAARRMEEAAGRTIGDMAPSFIQAGWDEADRAITKAIADLAAAKPLIARDLREGGTDVP